MVDPLDVSIMQGEDKFKIYGLHFDFFFNLKFLFLHPGSE